jgi:hypothetical protein
MPTCSNGHENPEGQRFCGECAEDLAPKEANASDAGAGPALGGDETRESQTPETPAATATSSATGGAVEGTATSENATVPGSPVARFRNWLSVRRNQAVAGGALILVVVVVLVLILGGGGGSSKTNGSASGSGSGLGATTTPQTFPTTTTTTPQPQQASGTSDQVVALTFPSSTPALLHATFQGSENFIVHEINGLGLQGELLVNTVGSYDGVTPVNFLTSEGATKLQIQGQGPWTITLSPIATAPRVQSPGTYSANGDAIVAISGSPTTGVFNYTGAENFIVHAVTSNQESIVVNEIGAFNGTEVMPTGTVLLIVKASGPWSVNLS